MTYQLRDLRYQAQRRGRDELQAHLRQFRLELKCSVGIWYFTPGGGRFHDRYVPEASVAERLEMAAELAPLGVTGIEAHYPVEVNEENVHLYQKLQQQAGIRLVAVGFSHFFERDFEFGSLSSPYRRVQEKAIQVAVNGLKLVRDAGADFAISWPGIDGYTYSLGTIFPWMWDRFEGAMAEALDEVPGVRVALEPKPYEPAPNNIYRTTAEGILAAQRIEAKLTNSTNVRLLKEGHALVGLNPEVGHVRMGFEDAAAAYSLVGLQRRLAHTHWNSQPLGNYDQDLNIGVVEWQQAEALMFALWVMGYQEHFGIDINPERMPVRKAVEINTTVLKIMQERLSKLPVGRILDCAEDPAAHRGELESILAENMRPG
ncbi:MAG TPA: TIM barrel protein [Phycisphaerae bacterium]|nr:TIM barrel protein [Phycisphaerae bacterium]HNU46956.1 TIM barrel protein [Phycisphaerae bacterium]